MLRMLILTAMAGIAMAASPASLSAQALEKSASITAPADQALTLAQLMSPRDLLVAMEVREFDRHFVPSLRADADLKSLEDEYPGMFDAMHKVTRGLVSKGTGRTVDQLHGALAALIQEQFSAADVVELINFYRSPVGQKTVQQMAGAADASQIYQQAVEQEDFKLTPEFIAEQNQQNARKAAQTFTPDEQAQMIMFMAKQSFTKLARAQPQIRKILAEKMNAPDPEFDREVEQAMSSAIAQHIASFEEKSDEQ
jgi:hypothetical protein